MIEYDKDLICRRDDLFYTLDHRQPATLFAGSHSQVTVEGIYEKV